MKIHNFNLKALILVLALSLAGQSYAHKYYRVADEKKVVKISIKEPLIKFISNTLNVTSADLDILNEQLEDANFYLVKGDRMGTDSNHSETFLVIEYNTEEVPLEDWMFEEDYLTTEAEPRIEDWMMDEDYLSSEAQPMIEDWMMDEDYLRTEPEPIIEGWMMDVDYLSTEAEPVIEDWMMDENYLSSESGDIVENWMFDVNYLTTESIPTIESWMLD